jgi:outer membrane protein assembly factor BamB
MEATMRWLGSLVILALFTTGSSAGDWPQWLGPKRDASSPENVAPWKQAPEVLWRQPVGEGNSSPVVSDGRVFVHAKIKERDEEEVTAFDAASGKELWRTSYSRAPFKSLYGNGPRATPVVANGRVYTFGITGMLCCFDAAVGNKLWQVDTLQEFSAKNLFFGMSCSPLVYADHVLVNVGGKGASIVALDTGSGKVVWKSLDDRASYSSPILVGEGADRQVIFLTQQGLVGLNPTDAGLYWRFPLVDKLLESSTTPVRAGDVLLASSITYGSAGVRLGTKDGKPDAVQLWQNPDLTCYFSTPVAVGRDHIYLVIGTKPPAVFSEAKLHCIETSTGKDLWPKPRVVGKYHASLMRTGDNKLLMLEEAGNLVLLDPDPKEYRELARARVCDETWAHPALANGRLYLRDQKALICLKLGEGQLNSHQR